MSSKSFKYLSINIIKNYKISVLNNTNQHQEVLNIKIIGEIRPVQLTEYAILLRSQISVHSSIESHSKIKALICFCFCFTCEN